MPVLFDFGISQEDPFTEQSVLDIHPMDRILSVASGGEVALSLISLNENIEVTAVDISEEQLKLCRLKLATALYLDFPENGCFLGYASQTKTKRSNLYRENIRPYLAEEDAIYWDRNILSIENGIVNAGRFEQYLRKIRFCAAMFIGKKNLRHLIACQSLEEQEKVFSDRIASRKSLQLLFKVAFHPTVYQKRGLREQALIHAGKSTGERFYSKFEHFCTSSLASNNYFLQYFLTGNCITVQSFPPYLQPENRNCLLNNRHNIRLESMSLQEALCRKDKGYYTKIHLSNIGDWLSEEQFAELLVLLQTNCPTGTRMCYRYLQKNHFEGKATDGFVIDQEISTEAENNDQFPFYGILAITRT